MDKLTIHEIVRKAEKDWITGTTKHSKYVELLMYETLNKIEAYLNSKHISGEVDYMGREKPFFNIVTAAVNIWYRATDIDRKNIIIKATKEADSVSSFLGTILLQKYMRQANFGVFLNDWGRTLARYGSAVSKFVEKVNELIAEVIPWNRLICDAVNFDANPKIEKFWLTPAQLQKRIKTHNYDKDFVEQILTKHSLTTRTTFDNQAKDTKADYIPIYEIHGELPLNLLTDEDEDKDEFQQQMHVVCFMEKNDNGKFDDYTLFKGKENQDPYLITHLIKEDGQTLSIGAVQHLFEAQWMVNHSQKQIKDHLDLASKHILQTSDGTLAGRNALVNIENGDILIHEVNRPITRLNNTPDIVDMQAFKNDWQAIGNQINGISEAMQGQNPPSDTAWRLQQAILRESHSLFELMTENKGLAIIEMMTKFIIPHQKKQMDTTEELSEILSDYQIKWIDSRYLPNAVVEQVNQKKKNTILSGQIYDPVNEPMDMTQAQTEIQTQLDRMGNQRFISPSKIKTKTWKMYLDDLEWEIDVTGESKNTQEALTTLSMVLQTIAGLQGQPMPPEMKIVFDKILNLTGSISPLELSQLPKANPMPALVGAPTMERPEIK